MSEDKIHKDIARDIEWHKYNYAIQKVSISKDNENKYIQFKERISRFKDVITLDEARDLAKQIFQSIEIEE